MTGSGPTLSSGRGTSTPIRTIGWGQGLCELSESEGLKIFTAGAASNPQASNVLPWTSNIRGCPFRLSRQNSTRPSLKSFFTKGHGRAQPPARAVSDDCDCGPTQTGQAPMPLTDDAPVPAWDYALGRLSPLVDGRLLMTRPIARPYAGGGRLSGALPNEMCTTRPQLPLPSPGAVPGRMIGGRVLPSSPLTTDSEGLPAVLHPPTATAHSGAIPARMIGGRAILATDD